MSTMIATAKITDEHGVRVWRCPNCNQKLAEIHGSRIVIRAGQAIISVRTPEIEQTCPRCGACSEVVAA